MKVRNGFVSNSSSSSFIFKIIELKKPTEEFIGYIKGLLGSKGEEAVNKCIRSGADILEDLKKDIDYSEDFPSSDFINSTDLSEKLREDETYLHIYSYGSDDVGFNIDKALLYYTLNDSNDYYRVIQKRSWCGYDG